MCTNTNSFWPMRGPFYNKLFTKLINIGEKFSTVYLGNEFQGLNYRAITKIRKWTIWFKGFIWGPLLSKSDLQTIESTHCKCIGRRNYCTPLLLESTNVNNGDTPPQLKDKDVSNGWSHISKFFEPNSNLCYHKAHTSRGHVSLGLAVPKSSCKYYW